jgi:hypothetical protein
MLNKQTPEHLEWEVTMGETEEDDSAAALNAAIPANANGEARKRKAKARS